jgi:lipoate-protein ligase B
MSAAKDKRLMGAVPDLLLFMAHPRTVAVGLRDRLDRRLKDLLVSPQQLEDEGIALTRSVRGGGITYHWPGQVVCYPVLHLQGNKRDIPAYIHGLEEVGIQTLRRFGVTVARRRDSAAHVGLWLDGRKLVSMGIRISRWVTSFGFVINLEGDHSPSAYIRPCGIEGAQLVTLEEVLGHAPPRSLVKDSVKTSFVSVFERDLTRMPERVLQLIRSPTSEGDANRQSQDE